VVLTQKNAKMSLFFFLKQKNLLFFTVFKGISGKVVASFQTSKIGKNIIFKQ
jgi:hypothetical protein